MSVAYALNEMRPVSTMMMEIIFPKKQQDSVY